MRDVRGGRLTMWALAAALLATAAPASAHHAAPIEAAPDATFDRLMVLMATGFYHPAEGSQAAADGLTFLRDELRMSDEAIARDKRAAIKFFAKRFGLDASSRQLRGRVKLEAYTEDARRSQRAFVASGFRVPGAGWEVTEGGWRLTVTDPAGVALEGEFEGVTAPAGTTMVFGAYRVKVTESRARTGFVPIVIRSQSLQPSEPSEDGSRMFLRELSHPEWGTGLAQGTVADRLDPYRRGVQANTRTVITFPALLR